MTLIDVKNQNFIIREWNIKDGQAFYKLSQLNHFKIFKAKNLDEAEKKIIEYALTFAQTKLGMFPVVQSTSQILVGICGLRPIFFGKEKKLFFEAICDGKREELTSEKKFQVLSEIIKYGEGLGIENILCHI